MIDLTYIWFGDGHPASCATWESYCRLRIYRKSSYHVVVLSEPEEESGTSVTNAAEHLATRIALHFNLDPLTTVWVEHYGEWREGGETFDFVTFTWESGVASSPKWCRTNRDAVEALIVERIG